MDPIQLVCPNCQKDDIYDKDAIDTLRQITCYSCGYSELPTSFEIAHEREDSGKKAERIIYIVLAGIVFIFFGYYVIGALALAAFFPPVIIVPVILYTIYRRRKNLKKYAVRSREELSESE